MNMRERIDDCIWGLFMAFGFGSLAIIQDMPTLYVLVCGLLCFWGLIFIYEALFRRRSQ